MSSWRALWKSDKLGYLTFGVLVGACGFGIASYAGIFLGVAGTLVLAALWREFTPKIASDYYLGVPFKEPGDLVAFWIGALLLALFLFVI